MLPWLLPLMLPWLLPLTNATMVATMVASTNATMVATTTYYYLLTYLLTYYYYPTTTAESQTDLDSDRAPKTGIHKGLSRKLTWTLIGPPRQESTRALSTTLTLSLSSLQPHHVSTSLTLSLISPATPPHPPLPYLTPLPCLPHQDIPYNMPYYCLYISAQFL